MWDRVFLRVIAHLMVWSFVLALGLAITGLVQRHWWVGMSGVLITGFMGFLILRGTAEGVQGLGPVYWTLREQSQRRFVRLNWMIEQDPPWREGRGVQFKCWPGWTLQIGLCRRVKSREDLVEILGAWEDDVTPEEIGYWTGE